MRSFPSTRSARFRALACATVLLASAATAVPQAAADDLKKRERAVQGQVRGAQGELNESSKALSAAAARLQKARASLSAAESRLATAQDGVTRAARLDTVMQQRLQVAERRLAAARVALDTARKRVIEQRAAIGELAADNYANGDPALMGLSAMLNSEDVAEVTSQLNTVDSLMSRQTTMLTDLKQARAQMVTEKKKVEQATAAVAEQRRDARANLVRQQGLERSAAEARAAVGTMVTRSRAAESEAVRARAGDAKQLAVLKQQENRIKALIRERSQRQRGGFRGDDGGFLLQPVPGAVTSFFGYRKHPIFGYMGLHDGTDFSAPCGTANRAVAAGTVISTSWSEVYGNRLYLDVGQVNGKNMTVVYNHLSSYSVSNGERVSRGETVGSSGDTGWSTGCHLHFTVLLDGSPVNPMNYF